MNRDNSAAEGHRQGRGVLWTSRGGRGRVRLRVITEATSRGSAERSDVVAGDDVKAIIKPTGVTVGE